MWPGDRLGPLYPRHVFTVSTLNMTLDTERAEKVSPTRSIARSLARSDTSRPRPAADYVNHFILPTLLVL